jgi:hypothetical protein
MSSLSWGLSACLVQLEYKALDLGSLGVPLEALKILSTNISGLMAITANLVVIFNHEMATSAVNSVRLDTSDGTTIASTNALDITKTILTVNPDSSLSADTNYVLTLTAAADVYGQTFTGTIGFRTA